MIEWLLDNVEWIFGGIGVTALVGLISLFRRRPPPPHVIVAGPSVTKASKQEPQWTDSIPLTSQYERFTLGAVRLRGSKTEDARVCLVWKCVNPLKLHTHISSGHPIVDLASEAESEFRSIAIDHTPATLLRKRAEISATLRERLADKAKAKGLVLEDFYVEALADPQQ